MAGGPAPRARVLVVDDDEGIRNILVRFLQPTGMEVAEAATGRRALELARATPFTVILTDLGLPDMSGAQLIRALRQVDPRARIVVLSGSADGLEPGEAADLRVDGVLQKPVGMKELVGTIRRLWEQRPEGKR